jgi:hypothetical protein
MRLGTRRWGASLSALLMCGALAAGCGSGNEDPTAAKAGDPDFALKADAICARNDKRIEAAAARYLGPGRPTRRQLARFAAAAVVPYTQQTIDGIARLSPPPTVADTVDAMLAEAQSVNDRLKAQPAALAGTDDPFAKVGRLAKQAGLDGCAGD